MTVYRLGSTLLFPPPEEADPSGLVAVGGDLAAERLVVAYASGIFPWPLASEDDALLWFSPDPRMVLRPSELHVSRSLRKTLRRGRYALHLDAAFGAVIRACADAPRPGQDGTWITSAMIEGYERLHRLGLAHSAEAWQDGRLVGGLYGVSLGSAFFAESMFTRAPDASKSALVALVRQLAAWGFELFDCQVPSEHVARLGATPWPRGEFLGALGRALAQPTRRGRWRLETSPFAAS